MPRTPQSTNTQSAERAILVGFRERTHDAPDAPDFDELARLTDTAGARVIDRIAQRPGQIHVQTYIGGGKANALHDRIHELAADIVIFNNDLSPLQLRNLERILGVKVIDRTQLILDIFAMRAHGHEGKIQVELAQLEYLLPRITGFGVEMSRLGAGIGTRGPGETKLEVDRRRIRTRITTLKRKLEKIERSRAVRRSRRTRQGIPLVALVGYTNSGKTTLFNALSGAESLAEDKLFATLDPLTRGIRLPDARAALLTDTVGFIRALPVKLIEAFKATLEEITFASLLLHVVDVSHPAWQAQIEEVHHIIADLGAHRIPCLTVLNKIDRIEDPDFVRTQISLLSPAIPISARRGTNLDALLRKIETMLPEGAS